MKNVNQNIDIAEQLTKFNLWGKDGRNSELLFTGTYDECANELKENYDENHPDYSIVQNVISDQWENPVEKIGYIKFANDKVIDYPL